MSEKKHISVDLVMSHIIQFEISYNKSKHQRLLMTIRPGGAEGLRVTFNRQYEYFMKPLPNTHKHFRSHIWRLHKEQELDLFKAPIQPKMR